MIAGLRAGLLGSGCGLGFGGIGEFLVELILGLFEFVDTLAKSPCEFRQALRPEKDKHDDKKDNQVGAAREPPCKERILHSLMLTI